MEDAFERFRALEEVIPRDKVRLSGSWTGKPQRRYASPEQHGTGAGPYVDTVDWRWDGAFEGTSALVGLALLVSGQRLHWVKSLPPSLRPAASFSTYGWSTNAGSVTSAAAFHGVHLPYVKKTVAGEAPCVCVVGASEGHTGSPHVVMRIDDLAFAVILFPASAISVRRARLWRLRESLASRLPPDLQRLLTRRRFGVLALE